MKLGFIGTGKITSAVIAGICTSSISYKRIVISHRNKSISQSLKERFKKITISKDNQEIVNTCDWIFLSVTPTVGERIIKNLNFKSLIIFSPTEGVTDKKIQSHVLTISWLSLLIVIFLNFFFKL